MTSHQANNKSEPNFKSGLLILGILTSLNVQEILTEKNTPLGGLLKASWNI